MIREGRNVKVRMGVCAKSVYVSDQGENTHFITLFVYFFFS